MYKSQISICLPRIIGYLWRDPRKGTYDPKNRFLDYAWFYKFLNWSFMGWEIFFRQPACSETSQRNPLIEINFIQLRTHNYIFCFRTNVIENILILKYEGHKHRAYKKFVTIRWLLQISKENSKSEKRWVIWLFYLRIYF